MSCWYLITLAVKKSDFRALNVIDRQFVQSLSKLFEGFSHFQKKFHGLFSTCKIYPRNLGNNPAGMLSEKKYTSKKCGEIFNWSKI